MPATLIEENLPSVEIGGCFGFSGAAEATFRLVYDNKELVPGCIDFASREGQRWLSSQ